MRQPDARAFLFDIQRACQLLREFTAGMTFQDYAEDRKTRSAVERQLEIVGEAVGQMLRSGESSKAICLGWLPRSKSCWQGMRASIPRTDSCYRR